MNVSTHLRGEVPPFCYSLVMHSDTSNSSQDDIFGNLHSKTSHTRDKDIGVLHALHSFMAQHITTKTESIIIRIMHCIITSHENKYLKSLLGFLQQYNNFHRDYAYSCLEYRPSSISASLPFLAMPWGDTTGVAMSLSIKFIKQY